MFSKVKELIAIRKAHAAFRLGDADLVAKHVKINDIDERVVIINIRNAPNVTWKNLYVIYNGNSTTYVHTVNDPGTIKVKYTSIDGGSVTGDRIEVPSLQCVIFTVE